MSYVVRGIIAATFGQRRSTRSGRLEFLEGRRLGARLRYCNREPDPPSESDRFQT